jgi:Zn-dependent protease with chaperone function
MAIDFFAAQDQARRNTRWLVVLFGLAVLSLLLLTNLLVCLTLAILTAGDEPTPALTELAASPQWSDLPWPVIGMTSALVLFVITVVILLKQAELRQGGQVVALALGGRRLDHQQADAAQLRLLNVVEEMAIAAQLPVPPVYLLPEAGINAFAAGFTAADAVIGVTEGCLQQLNREQLQGVIAHEFSHILNGDMRLNIRLLAWLHGILFVGHAGYFLLRSGAGHKSNSKSKDGGAPLLLLALGLMLLGYLGSLFGNLIKAAVSRQREYLADASAVQFTRNPQGLAGALQQIVQHQRHGRIQHPNADELTHLFFAEALSRWTQLFATHPPLASRIARLQAEPVNTGLTTQLLESASRTPGSGLPVGILALVPAASTAAQPQWPTTMINSCRQVSAAPAILCSCLLPQDSSVSSFDQHDSLLQQYGGPEFVSQCRQWLPQVRSLQPLQKLQLFQLLIPALKQLSARQFDQLRQLAASLTALDGQQDLLEWSLLNWLQYCVQNQFQADSSSRQTLAPGSAPILQLLSVCASQNQTATAGHSAWLAGLAVLQLAATTARPAASLSSLQGVLPQLLHCPPAQKKLLWRMLNAAVLADQQQLADEQLLLQALAMLLHIPAPLPV